MLDEVAKISLQTFNSLPKTGKPQKHEWTVMSCILKEEDNKFEAIALGTGSKCIGHKQMSSEGAILNDSHAEIMCRRAFLLYLYDQIENASSGIASVLNFDSVSSKFNLKDDVKFHFFTTMMPCGDASIFPNEKFLNDMDFGFMVANTKSEQKGQLKRSSESEEMSSKRVKRDIFRTGAKCLITGEDQDPRKAGENYHVTGVVRTKPGRGYPTLSASCSDKLAKWCYLGIQGALLSIFLEKPVYLSSFTIASNTPYSTESLQRALYTRFENIKMISPFKRTMLEIHQASNTEFDFQKDDCKKVCPSSIFWLKNDSSSGMLEVAVNGIKQGITKKDRNSEKSRMKICKAGLLQRFKQLCRRYKSEFVDLSYHQCKEKAECYQENWKNLKNSFKIWPEKQENLMMFH